MPKKKKKKIPQAETADRHLCYEQSVQCAEAEIDFVTTTFKQLRKRDVRELREDFCGTATVCCDFVARHEDNHAYGVDLDTDVLHWGREHRVNALTSEQALRVSLIEDNVLTAKTPKVDALLAMNFSYWLFKEREDLVNYFKIARESLKDDGIMFLDAFGGYESFQELEEEREIDDDDAGFTYVWDQASFNPINNSMICHISFHFNDGSVMKNAFTYDWRMYTLPEIRDILKDAGFKKSTIYWEGWDEDEEEGNGVYEPAEHGEADPGWVVYITAEK